MFCFVFIVPGFCIAASRPTETYHMGLTVPGTMARHHTSTTKLQHRSRICAAQKPALICVELCVLLFLFCFYCMRLPHCCWPAHRDVSHDSDSVGAHGAPPYVYYKATTSQHRCWPAHRDVLHGLASARNHGAPPYVYDKATSSQSYLRCTKACFDLCCVVCFVFVSFVLYAASASLLLGQQII